MSNNNTQVATLNPNGAVMPVGMPVSADLGPTAVGTSNDVPFDAAEFRAYATAFCAERGLAESRKVWTVADLVAFRDLIGEVSADCTISGKCARLIASLTSDLAHARKVAVAQAKSDEIARQDAIVQRLDGVTVVDADRRHAGLSDRRSDRKAIDLPARGPSGHAVTGKAVRVELPDGDVVLVSAVDYACATWASASKSDARSADFRAVLPGRIATSSVLAPVRHVLADAPRCAAGNMPAPAIDDSWVTGRDADRTLAHLSAGSHPVALRADLPFRAPGTAPTGEAIVAYVAAFVASRATLATVRESSPINGGFAPSATTKHSELDKVVRIAYARNDAANGVVTVLAKDEAFVIATDRQDREAREERVARGIESRKAETVTVATTFEAEAPTFESHEARESRSERKARFAQLADSIRAERLAKLAQRAAKEASQG